MNPRNLRLQLETWVQSELAAKNELVERLGVMERCIAEARDADLSEAASATDELLRGGVMRMENLRALLTELGRLFEVDGSTLTLSSITERLETLGESTAGLKRLRARLRDATADVLKRGRRIGMLASYHCGILDDLFEKIAADSGGRPGASRGALVDAQG